MLFEGFCVVIIVTVVSKWIRLVDVYFFDDSPLDGCPVIDYSIFL